MSKGLPFLAVALATAFVAAPAQSQVLQVSATVAGTTTNVSTGGSVAITAPATEQAVLAFVTVKYTGTSTATINSIALTGTNEMTVVQTTPAVPATLNPGQSLNFAVQYVSTAGLATTGQVILAYTENATPANFTFSVNGTAGRLTYSYSIQPSGAVTVINPGDSIAFPSTNLSASSTAVVTVFNAGTAASSIQSISASNPAFQVSGSTAPVQLSAGQQTSFNVTFTPSTAGSAQATLSLGLTTGSATFTLTGIGTTPSFSVTYALSDGNVHNLTNGSAIAFPAVDVNGTATANITILNQGTGSGSVTGISVAGSGFSTRSLPALPTTLGPNQNITFQIVFAPTQAGSFTGTFSFTIGGATIAGTLTGTTLSPIFSVAYVDPNTNNIIALQSGSTLPFPNTLLSASSTISVQVTNSGTGTGLLNSITLGGGGASSFQLLSQPALPASVPPSQHVTFSVRFSPLQQQTFLATLVLNLNGQTVTINLTGQGTVKGTILQVSVNGSAITTGGSASITAPGTGQAALATVTVQYTGTAIAIINSVSLTGTAEMTVVQSPVLPVNLTPGGSLTFTVQYISSAGAATSGQVAINYAENGVASTFTFFLNGTAPRLSYSYILPGGASTPLNPGDRITFPATGVGTPVSVVVNVLNSGSGSAFLQSVNVSGTGFQLQNFSPIQLLTSQQGSFTVVFTPQVPGTAQGSVTLGLTNSSVSFNLTGTGASPSFTVTYTLADGNAHILANGSVINFPSVDINGTAIATVNIVNQGTGSGSVNTVSVTGTGFQTRSLAPLPATVGPNLSLVPFQIVFTPTQAGSFSGAFTFSMSGLTISGTLAGATSSPTFSLAYVDSNTNNLLPLQDGASLPFPDTLVNAVSNITLRVTNNGAGTGFLNSLTLGGNSPSVFQILNQPSLPASVPPSQQVNFGVRFSPALQQTYSATLVLNLNGQTVTINLVAQGIGPQYTYTWSNTTGTTSVSPGGTIAIGNTAVSQTSTITISVTNAGAGDGQISPITVTGQGLSLSNPPATPVTIHSKASLTLTLNFSPTQPGAISGTLTIGSDTFTVTATGIGSLLTYSYTNSASTISVAANGIVIFQPTAVQSTSSVTFSIQNTGTSSTTISSINLGAASSVFSLQQLPALPTNLAAGSTITFSISFVPNGLGTLTATLFVNSASFTLSGTGTQPASLPAYQFQGPSGTQPAAQQPSIGLTLSAGYPLALQGTLTLTFTSAVFTDDPSIQFATGGRTAKFTIPANSTQAVFTGGATMMPLQTGTTAGTIVITPSFATQNGFDLTPASPTSVTMIIARSVAQLTNQSVTSETLSSFSVLLSGYSTTHALTQLTIQVNPKPGATFSATTLTVNVSSAATGWYQSTASQAFGGSFLIAIPFVLSNGSTTTDLVHQVQSLSITATNDVGTSSSISVPIP